MARPSFHGNQRWSVLAQSHRSCSSLVISHVEVIGKLTKKRKIKTILVFVCEEVEE
jgi:hypothetical protein